MEAKLPGNKLTWHGTSTMEAHSSIQMMCIPPIATVNGRQPLLFPVSHWLRRGLPRHPAEV